MVGSKSINNFRTAFKTLKSFIVVHRYVCIHTGKHTGMSALQHYQPLNYSKFHNFSFKLCMFNERIHVNSYRFFCIIG